MRKKQKRVPKTVGERYALSFIFRGRRYYFANRLGSKELARRYKKLGYRVRLMPFEEGKDFMIYTSPKPPHRGYQPPR